MNSVETQSARKNSLWIVMLMGILALACVVEQGTDDFPYCDSNSECENSPEAEDDNRFHCDDGVCRQCSNDSHCAGEEECLAGSCTDAIDDYREEHLDQCDVWQAADSGGVEGTLDIWEIGHLPDNATFDFRFDAYTIPDRFEVEYPPGELIVDTGWRGDSSYDGDPDYPGGVEAPGSDVMEDIFQKDARSDSFVVKAFGVDSSTAWEYDVRCRTE